LVKLRKNYTLSKSLAWGNNPRSASLIAEEFWAIVDFEFILSPEKRASVWIILLSTFATGNSKIAGRWRLAYRGIFETNLFKAINSPIKD